MGIFGIGVVLAPALGSWVGGVLMDNFDWRFLFYLGIPFGVVGIVLANLFLPTRNPDLERQRLDWPAILYLSVFLLSVLQAISSGQRPADEPKAFCGASHRHGGRRGYRGRLRARTDSAGRCGAAAEERRRLTVSIGLGNRSAPNLHEEAHDGREPRTPRPDLLVRELGLQGVEPCREADHHVEHGERDVLRKLRRQARGPLRQKRREDPYALPDGRENGIANGLEGLIFREQKPHQGAPF